MTPELSPLPHTLSENADGERRGAWRYPVLTALAALALGLSLWNIGSARALRELQTEVDASRQYIDQTAPLAQLNEKIIARLAQLSAGKGDEALKRLLAEHGVTFTLAPQAKPAFADPAPAKTK
jgi:uncharacterized protein HemX